MTTFLQNLRNHLDQMDMSLDQLAREAGISRNTIYSWYKNDRNPKLDDAFTLCEVLHVNIMYLLTGSEHFVNMHPAVDEMISLMGTLDTENKWKLVGAAKLICEPSASLVPQFRNNYSD
jgi:DNA-binding XRE family transcriptional regulator